MAQPKLYPVLLVEDNEGDLIFMQRAIRKANAPVSLYRLENGEAAVIYLLGEGVYADRERYPEPVLIITNMKMPRMNGLELLAWLKQQPALKQLPALVISSSEDLNEVNSVTALGGKHFVKTSSLDGLTEIVQQILSFLCPKSQEPLINPRFM